MSIITRTQSDVYALPINSGVTWQQSLSNAVVDPLELLQLLQLSPSLLTGAIAADKLFKLRVPREFIAKMALKDHEDPLLLQVLPLAKEEAVISGYVTDPLKEKEYTPCPGLLHKYVGRVLLMVSSACAVNCRFCFRRHFPYQNNALHSSHKQQALAYIKSDSSIKEVILSGGDPLVSSDKLLCSLIHLLSEIPHVKTVRIHTRLPLMIPQRITQTLVAGITETRLKAVMVIHCNHANEIDNAVIQSLNILKNAGVMLLNQTVLLQGINNTVMALAELNHRLFHASVLPYYLHMPDKIKNTAHFDVSEADALKLIKTLAAQQPGYLVPKLVKEEAGAYSKRLVKK